MGKLLSGPWDQQPSEKWAINQTEEFYHIHFPALLECRKMVQQTRKPFDANGDIRPVHCLQALSALKALNNCVVTTCRLLQTANAKTQMFDLSSLISLPSYYRLLSALHHIQDQASLLIKLLDTYRIDCCPPVSQSLLGYQRCAIREQYRALWQYLILFPEFFESLEEETNLRQKNTER